MGDLSGRRLAVYVGGSIAALKAGSVITELRRRGGDVRVAMTAGAARFVTPLALHSLSGHPVAFDGEGPPVSRHGIDHIDLGAWCECQVGVAVSASLMARLAVGLADDAVTTAALSSRAPLVLAPAMETAMWEHPATQANVGVLVGRGAILVGPVRGRLASGGVGVGRMAEPLDICAAVSAVLNG